jgi:hypothetical protein
VSRYQVLLVRASLLWLVTTATLGVVFMLTPGVAGLFRTTHVHLGLLGFFLSMVMGVAYWMMPRPGGLRQERLEAATFYLLHGGLALRLVAEPVWRATLADGARATMVTSGVLQLGAIVVFAWAMHQRVVTVETIKRKRGETVRR